MSIAYFLVFSHWYSGEMADSHFNTPQVMAIVVPCVRKRGGGQNALRNRMVDYTKGGCRGGVLEEKYSFQGILFVQCGIYLPISMLSPRGQRHACFKVFDDFFLVLRDTPMRTPEVVAEITQTN
jgi:hypothetical protein